MTPPQITVTAVPGSNVAGTTTIDAAKVDRVFTVHASASLTIDGITIKNGSQPGGDAASDESYEATDGGAILGGGSLTIENSVIAENSGSPATGGADDCFESFMGANVDEALVVLPAGAATSLYVQEKAERPVKSRPMISDWIESVPS